MKQEQLAKSKEGEISSPQQEELKHKNQVKSAFMNYSKDIKEDQISLFSNAPLNAFYQANRARKALMLEQAVRTNQVFLSEIIQYIDSFEQQSYKAEPITAVNNRSKIKTTLKQFFREWCSQSPEKDDFSRIVTTMQKYLKVGGMVLIPGCGLGRLVYQFVRKGYGAEGNQVTYFMLFGSNFIINCAQHKEQFKIFPFISSADYYYDQQDAFRSITIPDVAPSEQIQSKQEKPDQPQPEFSIVGGQFTEIYRERPEFFDGVATCFFLDTANNIFDYIDTIKGTLKKGGIWVNLGPLLFHYREMTNEVSIQVSWQILRAYIEESFEFIQERMQECSYCHDPRSEMSVVYNCINFVCRRKENDVILT